MSTPKPSKKQECLDFLDQMRAIEKIKPANSTRRTVMLVGKTRAGKTVIFNILQNPVYVPPNLKIFSDTVEASITNFAVEKTFEDEGEYQQFIQKMKDAEEKEKKKSEELFEQKLAKLDEEERLKEEKEEEVEKLLPYESLNPEQQEERKKAIQQRSQARDRREEIKNELREKRRVKLEKEEKERPKVEDCINIEKGGKIKLNCSIDIIDTPGLFELKEIDSIVRDDESLKKTILECMEHEINKIHIIFFVCSFSNGINSQDVEAFIQFMKIFEGAEDKIAMIITRTENLDEDERTELKESLKKEPRTKALLNKIKDRIYFSGAIPREAIDNKNVEEAGFFLENIDRDRNKLIEDIILSFSPCTMNQLRFVSKYEEQVKLLMKELKEKLGKAGVTSGNTNIDIKLKSEIEDLLNEIRSLKSFVISEESDDLYKEVIQYELDVKFKEHNELLKIESPTEQDKKKISDLRTDLDNNSLYIVDGACSFYKEYCQLVAKEFEDLCSNSSSLSSKIDLENGIISLRKMKAFVSQNGEMLEKYKTTLSDFRDRCKKAI